MNDEEEFLQQVRFDIETIIQDAEEYEEIPPTLSVQKSCLHLAEIFAPFVIGLKRAVFPEAGGKLSLAFQSLTADRSLSCKIASDGKTISVITIDEHMRVEQIDADPKTEDWVKMIKWVKDEQ